MLCLRGYPCRELAANTGFVFQLPLQYHGYFCREHCSKTRGFKKESSSTERSGRQSLSVLTSVPLRVGDVGCGIYVLEGFSLIV